MKLMLKCTKNLLIDNVVLIMKDDIIEVGDNDFVEDDKGNTVNWFNCEVLISRFCQGMEIDLKAQQIADHFEYLEIITKQTKMSYK